MPVQKDENGRRWVQAEVEVPGTPEEVWAAIATGPGVSSWFVPTTVEGQVGGAINASFGPGMDSVSRVTEWDPPHRYVAESRDDMGPEDPTVATAWIVEARAGGTCIVRVVHSWTTDKDDWDHQFEGHTYGWQAFFRILRLYLAHFAGRPCAAFQVAGWATRPAPAAFKALAAPFGLSGVKVGQPFSAVANVPTLGGIVESIGLPKYPELLLRLTEPAPGIAHLFPMAMGRQVLLSIRLYLYGDSATAADVSAEASWQAWLAQRFPTAA